MPSGPRIRANNVYGVISDNPLTAGSASFNSVSLPLLPVVAAAHAIVVFDPKRVFGDPEIVVVTAHTAASTVATILRGQYGTSPREHPQGTAWAHVPVDEDWIEILTSTTRPTDPYEGQFIYETDTNKLVGYGGVDWAPRDAGGTLGFAENRTVLDQVVTAGALLTGLSVVATVGAGRRIKVTQKSNYFTTVVNDTVRVDIRQDGVAVERGLHAQLDGASETYTCFSAVLTPTTGSHTYEVFAIRNTGTGVITSRSQAIQSSWLLVEDIGAV